MSLGESFGRMVAGSSTDVRPSDMVLGGLGAIAALGAPLLAVLVGSPPELGPTSMLEPGETAVRVQAVQVEEFEDLDDDLAMPHGDDPDAIPGYRAKAVPTRPPSAPSPRSTTPQRPSSGIRGLPRIDAPSFDDLVRDPSPPSEAGFGPGGPAVAPGDADPANSPRDPYAYVDPADEDPLARTGGVVSDDAEGDGGDPLAARAVASFRQRLQRWLSANFYVTGSGLSAEELKKARVRATIQIAEDRTVASYTVHPGGPAPFEAAARRALDHVMGQPIPDPPEHYPGPIQRSISVTFTCTESKCD